MTMHVQFIKSWYPVENNFSIEKKFFLFHYIQPKMLNKTRLLPWQPKDSLNFKKTSSLTLTISYFNAELQRTRGGLHNICG